MYYKFILYINVELININIDWNFFLKFEMIGLYINYVKFEIVSYCIICIGKLVCLLVRLFMNFFYILYVFVFKSNI